MDLRIVLDARRVRDFGIGTYIRNLVRALGALDRHDEYVLVSQPEDAEQFQDLPSNFRTVTYRHHDLEKVDHLAFPAFLRRLHPHLVHIPLNRVPLLMPRPYVVTVHDMGRQLFSGTGWRNQLSLYRARRGLMRAARVIAVSGATQRAAESVLGIPEQRFRRIYNAIDPRFLRSDDNGPAREKERELVVERYQVNYPYALYAGSIRPPKNVPRLIEAFAVLREELAGHPRYGDLRLIIIGDVISQNPAVRRAATQSRLGQAVRFLGFVPIDTLRAFYRSASVFAFPSLNEGFGLPPLEAMACGTPVLTSNVSSLPEVVGEAAVQVSPDNVFEIARGLKQILLDEALREKLIERGHRQARRFSWERTAEEVLETYREVCEPAPRKSSQK